MPKRKMILTLEYTGIGLLGLLTLAMLFPVVHAGASAITCDPEISTEGCLVAEAAQEVGTTVSTVLSLAMQNKVELEVVPRSNGTTSYAASKLAVSTNSHAGYSIYLQAAGEEGNLTGVTSNLSGVIKNTTRESVRLEQLEANSYGYALSETAVDDSTTYSHIPTTNTAIKTTTSTAVSSSDYAYGDAYYLAFGTHIDTTLPAGQYAGSVTVSAVANPITLQSLYDITEMQQMQPEICENTREGYTKQLVDTRDGKSYWVAKLKDGNCWMTQNLALDITEEGLKAADTDIEEDWNQESEYPPVRTQFNETGTWLPVTVTQTRSWNFGQWVMSAPERVMRCDSQSEMIGCAETAGVVDVSDEQLWQPTFQAQTGTIKISADETYSGYVAIKPNDIDDLSKGGIYDAHYLVGNYYLYNASTAGEAGMLTDVDITGSICPKGWKLPLSANRNNTASGSFMYLMNIYGNSALSVVWGEYNAVKPPFYFVRAGGIQNTLSGVGSSGIYNSATIGSNASSNYYLDIQPTAISVNNYYSKAFGRSMRCLAR